MKQYHFKRLETLANHLMSGKLGHKEFRFSTANRFEDGRTIPYSCGTSGCAIGECPIVFPRYWKFSEDGDPVLRKVLSGEVEIQSFDACMYLESSWQDVQTSIVEFFGITPEEAMHLFTPHQQNTALYGGKYADSEAPRKLVARNILAFIKIKKSALKRKA